MWTILCKLQSYNLISFVLGIEFKNWWHNFFSQFWYFTLKSNIKIYIVITCHSSRIIDFNHINHIIQILCQIQIGATPTTCITLHEIWVNKQYFVVKQAHIVLV
jgi:hypothetical protein